jgi:glucose/arabinose dehydrogenase
MGTLRGQVLIRLTLEGDRVVSEQRLLEDLKQRIRDVRQGPDGWIYVLTEGAAALLLRVQPG